MNRVFPRSFARSKSTFLLTVTPLCFLRGRSGDSSCLCWGHRVLPGVSVWARQGGWSSSATGPCHRLHLATPLVVSPADGRAPRHRCSPGRVIAGGECGLHWKFIVFMHSHKLMKESRALCESRDLDHFRPRAVIFIRL